MVVRASTLLLLLAVLTLARLSCASSAAEPSFAGSYTRISVAPSECIVPSSCEYQCSAAYKITVSGSTMTMRPTAKPIGCTCETLSAIIDGNVAAGRGADSSYSLALTPSGVNVITTVAGRTCLGIFAASSSTTASAAATTTRFGHAEAAIATTIVAALLAAW